MSSSPTGVILIDELKQLIAKKPNSDLELFDVREPHEYAAGFIPTAVNVPCESPILLILSHEQWVRSVQLCLFLMLLLQANMG